MALTEREQQLLSLLNDNPLLSPRELAERLKTTPSAIAVHLSNLTKKGVILGRGYIVRQESSVLVIGGANLDFKARSLAAPVMASSNPGQTTSTFGGVGRNIAENLARLGVQVSLISMLGRDASGERLKMHTQSAGVDLRLSFYSDTSTGTYNAVLNPDGSLLIAISDMSIMQELSPDVLRQREQHIKSAPYLVLDANLRADTLEYALKTARGKVVLEPVSVSKSLPLKTVIGTHPIFAITPNLDELEALTGTRDLKQACKNLHALNVEHVVVTLGEEGVYVSSPKNRIQLRAFPATVQDVTGAGDAFISGMLYALSHNEDLKTACDYGQAAAVLTLESSSTVNPELSVSSLESRRNDHVTP
ncbi:carbohydrate kinase [Deinococcus cellulosilyticus]|uniref:Carbohydrate kinase n=1 Tax=Deinococcus cellulosilyticus (strain DSM 18568 / NBRC 106333 / KACC 11606 / 5516J-15) TaxID=1223518 RepID=A0A511N703_DEIC1|nr:carbohydrate kinase [Deinococcus cellulosilyticus]GEM48258.1 carbohydrate kinase [Deinococcus cellulosilyticus NBRC 106333 = KACC 11606]